MACYYSSTKREPLFASNLWQSRTFIIFVIVIYTKDRLYLCSHHLFHHRQDQLDRDYVTGTSPPWTCGRITIIFVIIIMIMIFFIIITEMIFFIIITLIVFVIIITWRGTMWRGLLRLELVVEFGEVSQDRESVRRLATCLVVVVIRSGATLVYTNDVVCQ